MLFLINECNLCSITRGYIFRPLRWLIQDMAQIFCLQLAAATAPAVLRLVRRTVGRLVRGLADRLTVG